MKAWLDEVEAVLVAQALRRPAPSLTLGPAEALAGRAAVAAKFLGVGTPRTLGLAGCGDLAPLIIAAQRAYAAPRELRVFEAVPVEAARVADTVSGRVVSLAEACACDLVVCAGRISVRREWVRNGTLVTALDADVVIDPALLAAARVCRDTDLAAVAAGLVDGRSLDEIIVVLPD